MKDFLAALIVAAVRLHHRLTCVGGIETINYCEPCPNKAHYAYDRSHEDWNDYLRGTGL